MAAIGDPKGERPLTPFYGFNSSSGPIILHEGPLSKGQSTGRFGKIELRFSAKPSLCWSVEPDESDYRDFRKEVVELGFARHGGQVQAKAFIREASSGWINHVVVGQETENLSRVMVHWFNLPDITGNRTLEERGQSGTSWWRGRFQAECAGWRLVLDARRDHKEATSGAGEKSLFVMTHVMEVKRADGANFSVSAVESLIECLRVCLSFGFGRWVSPALPVGYGPSGEIVWEHWAAPICDPFARVGSGWLYRGEANDLLSLIECGMQAFNDVSRPGITRLQMCLAVQAVGTGFLEQRVLAAAPALESLAWSELVLGQRISAREYQESYAEDRLRYLLHRSRVPTAIDRELLPGLAAFAIERKIDGPTAVTRVRNSLVHPKDPHEQVYRHDGLMLDTWFLSLHYVRLLILSSIGYAGSYVPLHKRGWISDTEEVPWSGGDLSEPPLPTTRSEKRRTPGRRRNAKE